MVAYGGEGCKHLHVDDVRREVEGVVERVDCMATRSVNGNLGSRWKESHGRSVGSKAPGLFF